MSDKRCESCTHWTRDAKPSAMDTWWGLCDTLVAENGVVYVSDDGDGTASTRDTFECGAYKGKPAEPFMIRSVAMALYFEPKHEDLPTVLPQLAKRLNELWAEREAQ